MTAAMKPSAPADRWGASVSTRRRLVVSVIAGVAAGVLVGVFTDWHYGLLAGWIVAAGVLVAWTWLTIWPMDPRGTARHVGREDPGRVTLDVMVLLAAIASLGAVAALLVAKTKTPSIDAALSVAMAWGTVFTARYAALYYAGHPDGVDFNEKDLPQYTDFAYLAFTIGMTFQVSDTDLTTKAVRATALRHALLSYLLGAIIIATVINLVAGLAK